ELRLRAHRVVDVGAAGVTLARTRRADDQQQLPFRRGAPDAAADPVAGALARQRQEHVAGLSRVDVGAAGALSRGIVAGRADSHVRAAVAVDVADALRMSAEVVLFVLGAQCLQDATVAAGVDLRVAAARRGGDDIRDAVLVGVACRFDTRTELIAFAAVGGPELFARLGGIDIDAPRGVRRPRGRCRGDDVGDTVAVNVAEIAGDPSELVLPGLAVPLADNPHVFDERVLE